eukprot:132258_1
MNKNASSWYYNNIEITENDVFATVSTVDIQVIGNGQLIDKKIKIEFCKDKKVMKPPDIINLYDTIAGKWLISDPIDTLDRFMIEFNNTQQKLKAVNPILPPSIYYCDDEKKFFTDMKKALKQKGEITYGDMVCTQRILKYLNAIVSFYEPVFLMKVMIFFLRKFYEIQYHYIHPNISTSPSLRVLYTHPNSCTETPPITSKTIASVQKIMNIEHKKKEDEKITVDWPKLTTVLKKKHSNIYYNMVVCVVNGVVIPPNFELLYEKDKLNITE